MRRTISKDDDDKVYHIISEGIGRDNNVSLSKPHNGIRRFVIIRQNGYIILLTTYKRFGSVTSTLILLSLIMIIFTVIRMILSPTSSSSSLSSGQIMQKDRRVEIDSNTKQIKINSTLSYRVEPVSSRLYSSTVNAKNTTTEWIEPVARGVYARAFPMWNQSLPCYAPDNIQNYNKPNSEPQSTNSNIGFIFIKLSKTGSTTAAGVHLRIMKHIATKIQQKKKQNLKKNQFQYCQGRIETNNPNEAKVEITKHDDTEDKKTKEQKDNSKFVWTIVRDPTHRLTSQFFYDVISRNKEEASNFVFQNYIYREKKQLSNYYLQMLNDDKDTKINNANAHQIINKIISEFNFIGITERMDESLVALMMILQLKMSTILYLKTMTSGGYDHHSSGRCVYIHPSTITNGMKHFFEKKQWRAMVQWDDLFYQAIHRSLDMTIERLGREQFNENLLLFRQAVDIANDLCINNDLFPCTSLGIENRKTAKNRVYIKIMVVVILVLTMLLIKWDYRYKRNNWWF